MIAFYYGLTGFASVVTSAASCCESARNFLHGRRAPAARRRDHAWGSSSSRSSTSARRRRLAAASASARRWSSASACCCSGPCPDADLALRGHPEFFRRAGGRAPDGAGGADARRRHHQARRPRRPGGRRSGPTRRPGAGQVRIEVECRRAELRRRHGADGLYPDAPQAAVRRRLRGRRRRSPRSATASTRLAVGDRVMARHPVRRATPSRWSSGGRRRSRCPTRLSFEQGAAIPVNYATAWAGLIATGTCRRASAADPRRGRRRRHRRHSDRQGAGRRDLGHRVAGQARRDPRLRRRPPDRLHAERLGAGPPRLRPRHGRARRRAPSSAATRCCAPAAGWSPSAPRRSSAARSATCQGRAQGAGG